MAVREFTYLLFIIWTNVSPFIQAEQTTSLFKKETGNIPVCSSIYPGCRQTARKQRDCLMSCMIDSRCVAFTYTNQTCTNLETMSLEEAADAEIKWGSYYKKMGEELIPFQRIATDLITNIVASGPVFMGNVAKFGPWNLFDGKKTEEECEKALSGENEDMLQTNSLDEPYVLITLSLRQTIEGVKIWNRSYGGYHRRTADLEIRVSDDSSAMNTTESFCAYHDGIVDKVSQMFRCEKPVAGIYVRLQLLVMNQVFNIYEVELLSHA